MIDFDEDNYQTNDLSRKRVFVISGGNMIAQCTDPYGLWHIKPEKGVTPTELSGQYTSVEECEKAIIGYNNKKGRTISYKKETIAEVTNNA